MPRAIFLLDPGEQVSIRVRGLSDGILGPWSDLVELTAAIDTTAPLGPTNCSMEGGYRTIFASWKNDPAAKDIKFCFVYLDKSPIPVDADGRVDLGSLSADVRIHAIDADCVYISGLDPGTTYYARIETVNITGNRSTASGQLSTSTTDSPWDDWYLRLDGANGPLTSDLGINGHLVFAGGDRAVVADEGYNLRLKMGDSAGIKKVDFQALNNDIVATVSSLGKGNFKGLDAGGSPISAVGAPTANTDAATKEYVDDSVPGELDDLDDVNAAGPSDGQVLTWDETGDEWQAKDIPSPEPEAAIADIPADYAAGDLDSEEELIAAMNGIGAAINSILATLRAHGLIEI